MLKLKEETNLIVSFKFVNVDHILMTVSDYSGSVIELIWNKYMGVSYHYSLNEFNKDEVGNIVNAVHNEYYGQTAFEDDENHLYNPLYRHGSPLINLTGVFSKLKEASLIITLDKNILKESRCDMVTFIKALFIYCLQKRIVNRLLFTSNLSMCEEKVLKVILKSEGYACQVLKDYGYLRGSLENVSKLEVTDELDSILNP